MAIFSSVVAQHGPTKIFVRRHGTKQLLVVELAYASEGIAAVYIPMPTSHGNEVGLLDLRRYTDFFDDVSRAFPRDPSKKKPKSQALVEHKLYTGVYTFGDFNDLKQRLNQWLKLPDELLKKCIDYSHGVAVVMLPDTDGHPVKTYPIGFQFESRLPIGQSFVPAISVTAHAYTDTVKSDIDIYYQGSRQLLSDIESTSSLEDSVQYKLAAPVIVNGPAYLREVRGRRINADAII